MIRQFTLAHVWFLIEALRWTLALSAIAFAGGSVGGLFVALASLARSRAVRWAVRGYVELFQGTPLLMQLFTIYFGLSLAGIEVGAWTAVSVALIANSSAFLGEIWRGCIEAIPRAQTEAGFALGLRRGRILRLIVLPQALRIAVAPTVGFLVQIVKGTSLASLVNFVELMRAGQIVNNVTFRPAIVYSIVVALYFVVCWSLSLASRALERHLGSPHLQVRASV